MIEIKQLQKKYYKLEVLKGIDLDISGRGVIALLGPNGSGKTTLIKCILGMVLPSGGQISFNGENIKGKNEYRNDIDYLPQIAQFPENLSAIEIIELMKSFKQGETREKALIELFGLERELEKKMMNLSGGNRQKINLVIALMHDSPVIILDEPSTGLDPLSITRLKSFLRNESNRGKLILLTTHIMSLAEGMAEKVIFLLDGRIRFNGMMTELLDMQGGQDLESSIAQLLDNETV
ncbi:MAG TPA: ABC transporter ATP-binding protein [Saprospiraceae bacterium]|nr:ABC transporter ATP-binding protein [Saprospiraceae bacterium]